MPNFCKDCAHLEVVTMEVPDPAEQAELERLKNERHMFKIDAEKYNQDARPNMTHEQVMAFADKREAGRTKYGEWKDKNEARFQQLNGGLVKKIKIEKQGKRCMRPVGILNMITGEMMDMHLEAAYERVSTEHRSSFVKDPLPLCGPDGQFFEAKK